MHVFYTTPAGIAASAGSIQAWLDWLASDLDPAARHQTESPPASQCKAREKLPSLHQLVWPSQ